MTESDIMRLIELELTKTSSGKIKTFRINVGTGWNGKSYRFTNKQQITVNPGDVLIQNARVFSTGAPPGWSDLISFVPTEITADYIGRKIAIPAFLEVKTETGRVRPEQLNFINVMQETGCLAGIVRSPADAIQVIRG